jgi:hypothetical protein
MVGQMVNEEAAQGRTVEGHYDQIEDVNIITEPARMYP